MMTSTEQLSFDAINDINAGAASASYVEALAIASAEISSVEVVAPHVEPPSSLQIVVDDFDECNNILNDTVRIGFAESITFAHDDIFTNPTPTTITLEGFISNVKFHERELTAQLAPDIDCVVVMSNYGHRVYPGYIEPICERGGAARGRKPRARVKKQRRIQGSGDCFNSQTSFSMRSHVNGDGRAMNTVLPVWDDGGGGYAGRHLEQLTYWLIECVFACKHLLPTGPAVPFALWDALAAGDIAAARELIETTPLVFAPIVPSTTRIYKFKVFRTGCVQLPGARPCIIHDVITRAHAVAGILNRALHPGDALNASVLININPVMKNYKFKMRLAPREIIDLCAMKAAFCDERPHTAANGWPTFGDVHYTREDTKLSVLFNTPIYMRKDKCTRVNVFMRGKVNILGAYDDAMTSRICEYLYRLVQSHPRVRAIERGVAPVSMPRHVDISAAIADSADAVRAVIDSLTPAQRDAIAICLM